MAILVNNESGLAENIPDQSATQSLQAGQHVLPLNDPQGNPVTAPLDQAQSLISQGYSQPSQEQLKGLLDYAKYSTNEQQVKSGLEGAASAATFGLSTGIERAAGVNPEAIRARREINPGAHLAGEVGGLAATALIPGAGQANVMRAAGEAAAMKLGLGAAESLMGKVGAGAVKAATESAIMGAGDEVSKAFSSDPDQSAQTAMIDIGLSGLLGAVPGAAFGAASPLWKAANETKLAQTLAAVKNKFNNVEGAEAVTAAQKAAQNAGINLSPELSAAMSTPEGEQLFQPLIEGETRAGQKLRDIQSDFHTQAQNSIASALGKTPGEIHAAETFSDDQLGAKAKSLLNKEAKAKTAYLEPIYKEVEEKTAQIPLSQVDKDLLAESIGELQMKYAENPGSPDAIALEKIKERLGPLKTVKGFQDFQSGVGQELYKDQLWNLKRELGDVFEGAENKVVRNALGVQGADELLTKLDAADADYAAYRKVQNQIADKLSLGKVRKPSDFYFKLGGERNGLENETVLKRLLDTHDAGLLDLLGKEFPETANLVKQAHLDRLVGSAARKAKEGQLVNTQHLFGEMFNNKNAWSPELRKFALPEGAEQKLRNIQSLMESMPEKMNNSGTARTLDALVSKMPGGIMSGIGYLTGHGPAAGYLLGQLGRIVGREVPDAVKLATLRFLGSGSSISAEAFKTAVEMAASAIKGQRMTNAAVKDVFKSGQVVLPLALLPDHKTTKRLDNKLKQYQTDPEPLMDVGGHTPHYLPGHGVALGNVAAVSVNYLNSLRPSTSKASPLDAEKIPSQADETRYHRALQIAEQPLVVLQHIQQGTLIPKDIETLKTVYPALYSQFSNKLMEQVIDMSSKGKIIPYATRTSLAMFMGQPLDSTMTPQAIQSLQAGFMANEGSQGSEAQPNRGSTKALAKLPDSYMTPAQTREAHRISKA